MTLLEKENRQRFSLPQLGGIEKFYSLHEALIGTRRVPGQHLRLSRTMLSGEGTRNKGTTKYAVCALETLKLSTEFAAVHELLASAEV